MGTNYFAIVNKCDKCGRSDKFHIGKQSCGWEFHFRAWKYEDDGLMAVSFRGWRRITKTCVIVNEYGDEIPYKKFWDKVTATNGKKNHYDECIGKYGDDYNSRIYKDPDGWAFDTTDFF